MGSVGGLHVVLSVVTEARLILEVLAAALGQVDQLGQPSGLLLGERDGQHVDSLLSSVTSNSTIGGGLSHHAVAFRAAATRSISSGRKPDQ